MPATSASAGKVQRRATSAVHGVERAIQPWLGQGTEPSLARPAFFQMGEQRAAGTRLARLTHELLRTGVERRPRRAGLDVDYRRQGCNDPVHAHAFDGETAYPPRCGERQRPGTARIEAAKPVTGGPHERKKVGKGIHGFRRSR